MYRKLIISIGRRQNIAPNHVVSAVAGRANIPGSDIGKIEIYDDKTVVGVPAERASDIAKAMQGATICGQSVRAKLSDERPAARPAPGYSFDRRPRPRSDRPSPARARAQSPIPQRRGALKLSPEARAKLLDGADLGRFEITEKTRTRRPPQNRRHPDSRGHRKTPDRTPKRHERGPKR